MLHKIKNIILLSAVLVLAGCSAHPTISPEPLKKGETMTGVALSAENVFPVYVIRKGLTDVSDVGFRIGIPFYGSGIDFSRVMFERGQMRDILNVGYSFTPNANFDVTYYTVRSFKRLPGKHIYSGFRGMYIPNGISDRQSVRAGFLLGISVKGRFGLEAGYFHDFTRGQPIEKIITPDPYNDERYPAITSFGFPSENSRLTGLSFKFFIQPGIFARKK